MTKSKPRRGAFFLYGDVQCDEELVASIKRDGFTELVLSAGFKLEKYSFGFSEEQVMAAARMAEKHGLGVVAFTGYIKYREAVIHENPGRGMIVRDFSEEGEGAVKACEWLCPFQPVNVEMYESLLARVVEIPGLSEVWLNDEASLSTGGELVGCFCDHCRATYLKSTGRELPTSADWQSDEWYDWHHYRMKEWAELHGLFRHFVLDRRPGLRVGIQYFPDQPLRVQDSWKSGVSVGLDAKHLDVVVSDPYYNMFENGLRPLPRYLTETTRTMLGAAAGKEVHVIPPAFHPPAQVLRLDRKDGLVAGLIPFALGAQASSPYEYECMLDIPDYLEGFQQSARLDNAFAAHRPLVSATVLTPFISELHGHSNEEWWQQHSHLANVMFQNGIAWKWLWDQRLEDAREQIEGPLIVYEAHCLTQVQCEVIAEHAARGGGVLWVGNVPEQTWSGHGHMPLPAKWTSESDRWSTDTPELVLEEHELFQGMENPVYLKSWVLHDLFEGKCLGSVQGKPALKVREEQGRREAWIAGLPKTFQMRADACSAFCQPSDSLKLFAKLITWLSASEPAMSLDPWPPNNVWRQRRPNDFRNGPTAELFPMGSADSLFGLLFPYMPSRFETELVIRPEAGKKVKSVEDLWNKREYTNTLVQIDDKMWKIPIVYTSDLDLMAFKVKLES